MPLDRDGLWTDLASPSTALLVARWPPRITLRSPPVPTPRTDLEIIIDLSSTESIVPAVAVATGCGVSAGPDRATVKAAKSTPGPRSQAPSGVTQQ